MFWVEVRGVERVWSGLSGGGRGLLCVEGGASVVRVEGVEEGVGMCRGWSGCGQG